MSTTDETVPSVVTMRTAAAAALLDHVRPEPRVWRKGDPEPGPDVRAVLDRDNAMWLHPTGAAGWFCEGSAETDPWWAVLGFAPLVEVFLPAAVTE